LTQESGEWLSGGQKRLGRGGAAERGCVRGRTRKDTKWFFQKKKKGKEGPFIGPEKEGKQGRRRHVIRNWASF